MAAIYKKKAFFDNNINLKQKLKNSNTFKALIKKDLTA